MSYQSITDAPAYIVYVGRQPGVYTNWDDVHQQINDFPLAWYRPFQSLKKARNTYRIWKRQQKVPIKELLSRSTQASKSTKSETRRKLSRRKACVHWCGRLSKTNSIDVVREVVRIAKRLRKPVTVKSLEEAYDIYMDKPPWE